jgi:uncharacterized protein YukE
VLEEFAVTPSVVRATAEPFAAAADRLLAAGAQLDTNLSQAVQATAGQPAASALERYRLEVRSAAMALAAWLEGLGGDVRASSASYEATENANAAGFDQGAR